MAEAPKRRRRSNRVPSHRKHATGQGVVTLNGKDHYTGKWGTAASDAKHRQLISQWIAGDRKPLPRMPKFEAVDEFGVTVAELAAEFKAWADKTYQKDGVRGASAVIIEIVMRMLGDMFGDLPASSFAVRHFIEARESLMHRRCARTTINYRMQRVKMLFNWASIRQLVDDEVTARIARIRPLKRGEFGVREPKPTTPANDSDVEKVKKVVPAIIATAIEFQRRTGCRAGEMLSLRPRDVDTSGDVWLFRPHKHKTEAYGVERIIPIGRLAQTAIAPLLEHAKLDREVFRLTYGPDRGERMTPEKYAKAVRRGCVKSKCNRWRPHQLRHLRLTELRNAGMLEEAQAVAGHKTLQMTQHYARLNLDKGIKAAKEGG